MALKGFGCIPPSAVELARHAPAETYAHIAKAMMATPTTLDYSSKMLAVSDQGSRPMCAAYAAAAIKEWQEKSNTYMSPQFVYNNRRNAPNDGMYGSDVMDILNKLGDCYEQQFPIDSKEMGAAIPAAALAEAAKGRSASYAPVGTIDGLKAALTTNGPCWISMPAYNNSATFWRSESKDEKLNGHAVTVVGYDANGFKLRNSWGTSWGSAGYTIFPYADWGTQWEVWSCVDDLTQTPDAPQKTTCGCFG